MDANSLILNNCNIVYKTSHQKNKSNFKVFRSCDIRDNMESPLRNRNMERNLN